MLVRSFVRSYAAVAACLLAVTGFGCAAEKAPVTVFMYSEYIDPKVPEEFEKATGYKLNIEVYEGMDEMQAKLRAGAVNQYDVVVATDVMVKQLVALKLVQPLDQKLIPNGKNVDPQLASPAYDQGNQYSYPYQWGTIGLLYDTSKVPAGAPTWKWIFDSSAQVGPFVLMDEMRPMLGIALKFQGRSMNSRSPAEVKAAVDLLIATKGSKKCQGFAGAVDGKNKVVAGELVAAVVYNGDAVRALGDKPGLAYSVPVEGSNIWVDNMLVTSKAPNLAGAHAFINYALDPKVAAQISNFNRYATPVKPAMEFITPEDKANPAIYPTADTMKTLQGLDDVDKDTRLYNEAWTTVKAQ
jgi:spermidine/putrescine transport system substrate-binding protein